jgi:predicted 3-demethylubiquinone-9 3-methyltransferase (glyoxalase superfamily)
MQKISTCLWFDRNAEEAVNFYSTIFKNFKTKATSYYPAESMGPQGSVMTIVFEMEGREFMALNGGPMFKFTEAISLMVYCEDQAEIDDKWDKLLAGGGQTQACGWLKDKFGLSWQIIPEGMEEMLGGGKDPAAAKRAMEAVMKMVKFDIKALKDAYAGK